MAYDLLSQIKKLNKRGVLIRARKGGGGGLGEGVGKFFE